MKKLLLIALFTIIQTAAFSQQCYTTVSGSLRDQVNTAHCTMEPASVTEGRLSHINYEHCKNIQLFTVSKTSTTGKTVYTAFAGGYNPIYSGEDYNALVQALHRNYSASYNDVYFDLDNFTSKEEENLQSTSSVKFFEKNNNVRINTFNRETIPVSAQNEFFYKAKNVTDIQVGDIVEHETKNHTKYFSGTISFLKDSKRAGIQVFSDLKVAVKDFMSLCSKRLSIVKPTSVADITSDVRTTIMKQHGISQKNLIINFKSQLSNSMMVKRVIALYMVNGKYA